MESQAFTAIAPHYDVLMRDVPYRHWVRYLRQLLQLNRLEPRRVLDVACGTGNVSEILAASGCDVTGVDISEGMIQEARRKAERRHLRIDYRVQDAARLNLDESNFDLTISLFDSLNYVLEPNDLRDLIRGVYAHLRDGGLFIFDINSVYSLENNFFDQNNLETDDRLRYVWRSEYDAATRLCTVSMRFFLRGRNGVDDEFRETHVQYAYTEDELREMLSSAGFSEICTYHAYTVDPVRETTDRIFFTARR